MSRSGTVMCQQQVPFLDKGIETLLQIRRVAIRFLKYFLIHDPKPDFNQVEPGTMIGCVVDNDALVLQLQPVSAFLRTVKCLLRGAIYTAEFGH